MSKAWFILTLLAFPGMAKAEEVTRAWHIAAPPVAAKDESAQKLEALPTPSIFAKAGDRLIDLSADFRKSLGLGAEAWLVWNDSRKLLIAHGSSYLLDYAERLPVFNQPIATGITLAWYQGIPVGHPVPADATPVHRQTALLRTGFKSHIEWKAIDAGSLTATSAEIEPAFDVEDSMADITLALGWNEEAAGRKFRWTLDTSFSLRADTTAPFPIAQATSPSGEVWTITFSNSRQFLDGTLFNESRWEEKAGKAERLPPYSPRFEWRSLGKVQVNGTELTVMDFRRGSEMVLDLLRPPTESPEDPFSLTKPRAFERPEEAQDAIIPKELEDMAPTAMWDLRPMLRNRGVDFTDQEFCGYDPLIGRVVCATAEERRQAMVEQLFMVLVCGPQSSLIGVTVHALTQSEKGVTTDRGLQLIGRPGMRPQIECYEGLEKHENQDPLLSAEFEPVLSQNPGALADLNYHFHLVGSAPLPSITMGGNAKLTTGLPSTLQSIETGKSKTTLSFQIDVPTPDLSK